MSVVFLLATTTRASAQTMWTPPYRTNQIALEWVVPTLGDGDFRISSGAAYLDLSVGVTRRVEVIAELPFAYRSVGSPRSTTMVGDPYVGIGLSALSVPLLLEIGARVPVTADDAALAMGRLANVGRSSAFRSEEQNASALLSWRYLLRRHLSVRLRGGVVAVRRPEGAVNPGRRARLRYSGQLWYEKGPIIAGLTATGRVTPSAPGSFRAKSVHHVMGTVMVDVGPAQPGLLIGAPIDQDLWEEAPLLIGLTLSASYRR
ncbi:MAG: hypothetical protein ABEK03_05890 [Candidatus Bipolaricaulia bacterium]